jgi:hypothetical protein
MAFLGITIEILEYFPQNFNFDNFNFIFTSESKDFEKDISILNKNQIFQKIPIPKKNLKYSIKVTKNNSLVGISDLIIPSTVFSKKETSFDKTCQITMTESIKRLIFGNSTPNTIKINIHSSFQYLEKGEKFIKPAASNISLKKEEKRSSTPKKLENNNLKKMKFGGGSNTNLKLNKEEKKTMNKKLTEDFKKRSNSKPHSNNLSSGVMPLNIKNKNHPQIINKEKEKEIVNPNIKKDKKERKESGEELIDTSIIDEDLKNPISNISSEFLDFIPNFEKKYPLEKLNEFTDPYEMINYTKNIINELLNYQLNYYNILTNSVNLNKKFNELLIKYNEKYRLTLKKINKLEEENSKNEIQNELITDIHRNDFNNLKQLLPLKQSELDLYKEMYSINLDENEIQKFSEEQMKQIEEKKSKDANTQLLLIRVLKNIYNKYGPLNKLLDKSNSNENEINNVISLSAKYNLPISEEVPANNDEFEYVSSNNPDDIDRKIEKFLKNLYNKKKVPKIIFKKLSNNSYEYGTQKVTIKIDGDSIKAKSYGGFILLDKFIDNNAALEDNKMKNSGSKNSLSQNKKKKK